MAGSAFLSEQDKDLRYDTTIQVTTVIKKNYNKG